MIDDRERLIWAAEYQRSRYKFHLREMKDAERAYLAIKNIVLADSITVEFSIPDSVPEEFHV